MAAAAAAVERLVLLDLPGHRDLPVEKALKVRRVHLGLKARSVRRVLRDFKDLKAKELKDFKDRKVPAARGLKDLRVKSAPKVFRDRRVKVFRVLRVV